MALKKIGVILFFLIQLLLSYQGFALNAVSEIQQVDSQNTIISEAFEKDQNRYFKLNKIATILTVAMVIVLCLLSSVLYANNRLRSKANKLLQQKNIELISEKENAEKANRAKAEFLSTITHELRTPLYAVTGLTHLLIEENPTQSQKDYLESLKFSGEYLLSLVNNILDFNKLEKGNIEVDKIIFNPTKRMHDVLEALRSRAKERGNQLNLKVGPNVPHKVKGDALKISQIIINLVGNAIKFTENGVIDLYVNKVNDLEMKKVLLYFEVADSGQGISKAKQQNLFKNFNNDSLQINTKYGGSGLGLSIVKRLLHLMDAKISLQSEVGKGSKFYFELPFEIYTEKSSNEVVDQMSRIDFAVMKGAKVLIVEDNKINQLITKKILQKQGVQCSISDNGELAIEKAKNFDFDLILMDIHMPGITGLEATKEIRKFDMRTPIIALTAVTLKDNLKEFYAVGMTDVIPKPYKTEEFFMKLEKALKSAYV